MSSGTYRNVRWYRGEWHLWVVAASCQSPVVEGMEFCPTLRVTGYWQPAAVFALAPDSSYALMRKLGLLWPTLKSRKDPTNQGNPAGYGPPELWRRAWLESRCCCCAAVG